MVSLQQTGEGSLLVTWTASPGDTVNGYIIYYQRDGGEEESSMVDAGADPGGGMGAVAPCRR